MPECLICGKPLPPQEGPGARRKYHPTCRPPRVDRRKRAPLIGLPTATTPVGRPRPSQRRTLFASTLADLEHVDRQDTTAGIRALHLAELIDAGGYNAQGAASLAKAHKEHLAVALEGASPTADVIDVIFGAG